MNSDFESRLDDTAHSSGVVVLITLSVLFGLMTWHQLDVDMQGAASFFALLSGCTAGAAYRELRAVMNRRRA